MTRHFRNLSMSIDCEQTMKNHSSTFQMHTYIILSFDQSEICFSPNILLFMHEASIITYKISIINYTANANISKCSMFKRYSVDQTGSIIIYYACVVHCKNDNKKKTKQRRFPTSRMTQLKWQTVNVDVTRFQFSFSNSNVFFQMQIKQTKDRK